MDRYPALIGGDEVDSKESFQDIDPPTRQTLAEVARCGAVEMDQAVAPARESQNTGKPLRQARTDAEVAPRYFEFYAGTVEAVDGDTIPAVAEMLVYTLREPYEVTGHIVPWNYPMRRRVRLVQP